MRTETVSHRLTIDIPINLHKIVKVNAVLNDMSVKDYIVSALSKEFKQEFAVDKKVSRTAIGNKKANKATLSAVNEIRKKKYKSFDSVNEAMRHLRKKFPTS